MRLEQRLFITATFRGLWPLSTDQQTPTPQHKGRIELGLYIVQCDLIQFWGLSFDRMRFDLAFSWAWVEIHIRGGATNTTRRGVCRRSLPNLASNVTEPRVVESKATAKEMQPKPFQHNDR
jgi:hypothetical protein